MYHGETSKSDATMQENSMNENVIWKIYSLFLSYLLPLIHTLKQRPAMQAVEAHNRHHSKPRLVE